MATTPGTSWALTAARRTASTCGSVPAAASAASSAHAAAPRLTASALVAASIAVLFKTSRRVGLSRMSVLFSRPPYHRVRDRTNSAYHTLPLRYLQSLDVRRICKRVEPRPFTLGKPHRLSQRVRPSADLAHAA